LDWAEEGGGDEEAALAALAANGLLKLKMVVLKHMFNPEETKTYSLGKEAFYHELKVEVGMEVEKKAGAIEKLHVFEGNPEGVILVKFKSALSAVKCIELFDTRWFGGQQLECSYFDGKTDYRVKESAEKEKQRLEDFGKWLEQ
jgi:HIV Tat-specific factor 1